MRRLWSRWVLWRYGYCFKHKTFKDSYDGWQWCNACDQEKREAAEVRRDREIDRALRGTAMNGDELELLLEPLKRQIDIQKTSGNTPDALLMSTETLKKLTERTKGLDGVPNKLDILGVPIVLNEEIPYCKIGLSIDVPEGNLEKTLEGLKDGI